MIWQDANARAALRAIFDACVASADPRRVLATHLPPKPNRRCIVVGAGKSAAVMAAALEEAWPDVPLAGLVVTRYGHAVPTQRIEVMEASHPVPDDASETAARRMLAAVAGLGPDDLVLALMSGGGSALLCLPAPGLSARDKQAVNQALLACGATISEMNVLRKHLSAIKGGRLAAAAAPAKVVTLAISDVPGDNPAVIASGPTVPDPTTYEEARALAARYRLPLSTAVAAHLAAAADETPKPGAFTVDYRMIATPAMALQAAAETARGLGLTPLILGDALEGESREMATVLAGIAASVARQGQPLAPPAVLLSGGESTVTLGEHGHRRGGRNTEFLLALAVALEKIPLGTRRIWAVAGDTDGIDGNQDAAGALIGPDTMARARAAGFDPRAVLADHDSYRLFDALGDLIRTGPTLTNVNDVRAIAIV